MSDEPTPRLSEEEIEALKFAARRQLTRWAQHGRLSPRQDAQRAPLVRAVRILEGRAFRHGCDLHPPAQDSDA